MSATFSIPSALNTFQELEEKAGAISGLIAQFLRKDVVRIDLEGFYPKDFLHRLGAAGGFSPHARTPEGIGEAISVMDEVGRVCGSTAFLVWCQDACVWYLTNTDNDELREQWLNPIASGERLGATALSNPMKYFSGIENLKLQGEPVTEGYRVNGALPWVSNLGEDHAFGCIFEVDEEIVMALVECGTTGLQINPTARFAALEGTATYALRFRDVFIAAKSLLARPAQPFVQRIRSGFVLLQLGIGFGIIQGSIDDIRAADHSLDAINCHLPDRADSMEERLYLLRHRALHLAQTPLDNSPHYQREVFRLRLETAELAFAATQAALLHAGARGFIASSAPQRRCREAMFFAILTPSIKHLRKELGRFSS